MILYARECGLVVDTLVGEENIAYIGNRVSGYIANSAMTREDLLKRFAPPAEKIHVAPPFVSAPQGALPGRAEAREELCNTLNIPKERPIITMCGGMDFRKGPDFFVHLAHTMREVHPDFPVVWVWIGGYSDSTLGRYVREDVAKAGLQDSVLFTPPQSDPLRYMAGSDILVMTSRSEPFGRVVLEAAAVGAPTVCFDKECGAREFVEQDCGVIVPYMNAIAMARAIRSLLEDDTERGRLAQNAQRLFFKEYEAHTASHRLLEAIETFAKWGTFQK